MKREKIILIIILILIIIFTCTNLSMASGQAKMEINSLANSIKEGENISIIVKIKELPGGSEGVNAYVATVVFDTTAFEFVNFEGMNSWNTPAYNAEKIKTGECKVAATRANFSKEIAEILKITLRAKKNVENIEETTIKFKEISLAAKIDGKIVKVNSNDIAINNNSLGNKENSENNNSDGKENETGLGNNTYPNKKNDNTITDKVIPNAGNFIKRGIYILASFLIVNYIVSYIKIKKYKDL